MEYLLDFPHHNKPNHQSSSSSSSDWGRKQLDEMSSSSSSSSSWGRLVAIAMAVLPIHILTSPLFFAYRRSNTINSSSNRKRRSVGIGGQRWFLPLLLLLSLPIILFSSASSSDDDRADSVNTIEIQELRLKLSRLEFILEENTQMLNSRTVQLHKNGKLIEEMEHKIQLLQNSVSMIQASEDNSLYSEKMVKEMEEEVRLLWAESRKNNFNHHILESEAHEEEKKMEVLTSEVEKMENVVTEQWIQIQQLEQALQTMKIMTSKVRKKSAPKVHKKMLSEWTILKFLKGVGRRYLPEVADLPDTFFLGNYISKSCISRIYGHLIRVMAAAKTWHHELQHSVKWALETNQFTACLANGEIIFFLASAIVVIPIISMGFML